MWIAAFASPLLIEHNAETALVDPGQQCATYEQHTFYNIVHRRSDTFNQCHVVLTERS